jgi:hypothetical protein
MKDTLLEVRLEILHASRAFTDLPISPRKNKSYTGLPIIPRKKKNRRKQKVREIDCFQTALKMCFGCITLMWCCIKIDLK